MPSPAGIFVGLPIDRLNAIRQISLERAVTGSVVSIGGGAKNQGKQFDLTASQALIEVNFAIQTATNTLPPRKVVNVLAGGGFGNNGLL